MDLLCVCVCVCRKWVAAARAVRARSEGKHLQWAEQLILVSSHAGPVVHHKICFSFVRP